MFIVKEITKECSSDVLAKLLVLHQELDVQETEASKLSPIDALEGYEGWFDDVDKCFEDKVILGAWSDKELVGFIACRIVEGYLGSVGIISLLYVNPEYQRQGLGRMLWNNALAQFGEDIHHITLDVFLGNVNAIAFYEAMGLKPYMYTMGLKL